jgi:adenylate cyclase
MADVRNEAFQKILEQERRWNARYLNTLRPVGVSLFVVLQLVVYGPTRGTYVLLAYWVLAFLVFFGARRSKQVSRWSTLAVPFLDMPAAFLKQWLDMNLSTAPRAVANFSLGLFALLIMLAAFTLRNRQVVFAGFIAIFFQYCLQWRAEDTLLGKLGGIVALILAALLCEVALAGRIRMAHRLAAEHLRLEKLSRYFSPQVAAAIEVSAETLDTGQTCEITVLFSDLRGFTAATEHSPPADVVCLLNQFHSQMVEVIFSHDGTLDKYIGDGLMAYFGAPVRQSDHAVRALRCSLAMQIAVRDLNARRASEGKPPLQLSIGLHTGPATVGAIGAANRREFTAVGDTVNVAARIESLTREYNCGLLISGATARRVGDAHDVQRVAEVRLRGRSEPVQLFVPRSAEPVHPAPTSH